MPTCVSEGSYNVLFVFASVVAVGCLVSTVYYYDRFTRIEENRLTARDATTAKMLVTVNIVFIILAIAVMFVLYFGFTQKIMGVYTHTKVSVPKASPAITKT